MAILKILLALPIRRRHLSLLGQAALLFEIGILGQSLQQNHRLLQSSAIVESSAFRMKTDGLLFIFLKDSVSPLEIGECGRTVQIRRKLTPLFSLPLHSGQQLGMSEVSSPGKYRNFLGCLKITSSALRPHPRQPNSRRAKHKFHVYQSRVLRAAIGWDILCMYLWYRLEKRCILLPGTQHYCGL